MPSIPKENVEKHFDLVEQFVLQFFFARKNFDEHLDDNTAPEKKRKEKGHKKQIFVKFPCKKLLYLIWNQFDTIVLDLESI